MSSLLPRIGSIVVAASLTCSLSGCSYLFVSGPGDWSPERPPQQKPDCTTTPVMPLIDGIITGIQGVRTILAISLDDRDYVDSPLSREADIGLGLGLGVLFLASTITGANRISDCKGAERAWQREKAKPSKNSPWAAPPTPVLPSGGTPKARDTRVLGDECDHDATCPGSKVCERGTCTTYQGPL